MSKKELTASQLELRDEILGKLSRNYGRTLEDATPSHIYKATALTVRDKIVTKWTNYRREQRKLQNKEIFYLSFEFLMGRALGNNLLNIGLTEDYEAVLESMGCSLKQVSDQERDAALGNGGLGRLAACFIDSLTTVNFPAFGCSIRYEYGLFKQAIVNGEQVEMYDDWLVDGHVWEIARPEEQQIVRFGGKVYMVTCEDGKLRPEYEGTTDIIGIPYDMPIAGYNAEIVNTLRLWSARAKSDIRSEFSTFSDGDHVKAAEERAAAEAISKVLYPEDNEAGKVLRLRQQYFFVSCTLQWIIARFKRHHGNDLSNFSDYIALHINDTHPAIAIPELMRLLMDQEGMNWEQAWAICEKTFAYTNHTVLAEALEKWPVETIKSLLPRIWMILEEINKRLQEKLLSIYGEDWGKINYMAVIAYGYVSMANLCLCCCHKVNGVSELHTEILKKEIFNDYYNLNPEKFIAITNGITYRRWLRLANPQLSELITKTIGKGWEADPMLLEKLVPYAEDEAFQKKFMAVKLEKKKELAAYIKEHNGIDVDPNSIFDVQVKRLHEYKRQLLNVLHIIYLYDQLKKNPDMDIVPHTFIFGAKAARSYARAKLIIKLINDVAKVVNNDPDIKGKIKVVFIENYGVTLAQMIIPAADISQQISTAGLEASGTGNMKFMANGALTCGTMDGANVEMSQCVGKENMFIFGMTSDEVSKAKRHESASSQEIYAQNPKIRRVLELLLNGTFNTEKYFFDLYQCLVFSDKEETDKYMVIRDFASYIEIHEKMDKEYRDQKTWTKKAILNVAKSGFFSSDRTIEEYNDNVWHLNRYAKKAEEVKSTAKAPAKTASKAKKASK